MSSTTRRHRWSTIVTTLVAASGLLVAGCGSDDEATDGAAPTESSTTTTSASDPAPNDDDTSDDGSDGADAVGDAEELFPDVLGATAELDGSGSWTFSATLSSPYDSAERYADAWRVIGPDGEVYGIRELAHDHASEQPFTRSQSGIVIPADVTTVTVEGRDQISGWGGATVEVTLER